MSDIARRLLWSGLATTLGRYASTLLVGSVVSAQAAAARPPVSGRDELAAGMHRLSGMVMVPSACDELSVRTEKLGDYSYGLVFKTWREPAIQCSEGEVARSFHTVLYGPATGVTITASLDGRGFAILLLPTISGVAYTR